MFSMPKGSMNFRDQKLRNVCKYYIIHTSIYPDFFRLIQMFAVQPSGSFKRDTFYNKTSRMLLLLWTQIGKLS